MTGTILSSLWLAFQIVGLAVALGLVAGVLRASMKWAYTFTLHRFNKRGGTTYLILSGSPEVVQQMYEVCVRVANTIVEKQTEQTNSEGIQLADDSEEKTES